MVAENNNPVEDKAAPGISSLLEQTAAEELVMLSTILRTWHVSDERGKSSGISDLSINTAEGDRAPVSGIMLQGKKNAYLTWQNVTSVESRQGTIHVKDLAAAEELDRAAMDKLVLLERDVQDALVINLRDTMVMRANDLGLGFTATEGWLIAVDVSAGAVIRRIGRGRLNGFGRRELVDWKDIEFLRGDPQAALNNEDYHRQIQRLLPVEIARLTGALPYLHAAELLLLLPDGMAADVMEDMPVDRQVQVIDEIGKEKTTAIISQMAPDTATDLLGQIDPERVQQILEGLPPERSQQLIELLRYPPDTAGGIMTTDVVTTSPDLTIGEALEKLRGEVTRPDLIYFVYVVDKDSHLLGMLTLRTLIAAKPTDLIRDVMQSGLITLDPLESAESAAQEVLDNHLLAIPVVSNDERLLGMVTIDDATKRALPESWNDRIPKVFS